jgi:hypothetical protein
VLLHNNFHHHHSITTACSLSATWTLFHWPESLGETLLIMLLPWVMGHGSVLDCVIGACILVFQQDRVTEGRMYDIMNLSLTALLMGPSIGPSWSIICYSHLHWQRVRATPSHPSTHSRRCRHTTAPGVLQHQCSSLLYQRDLSVQSALAVSIPPRPRVQQCYVRHSRFSYAIS